MSGEKPETEDTASRPESLTETPESKTGTGAKPAEVSDTAAISAAATPETGRSASAKTERRKSATASSKTPNAGEIPGVAPSAGADPAVSSAVSKPSAPADATSAAEPVTTNPEARVSPLEGLSTRTAGAAAPLLWSPSDTSPAPPRNEETAEATRNAAAEAASVISDAPPAAQAAPTAPRRSGFVPALLGGVIAAGLGFGLAQVVPQGWPFAPAGDRLAQQQQQIDALTARLAALGDAPRPDPALTGRLEQVEGALAGAASTADLQSLQGALDEMKAELSSGAVAGGTAAETADLTPLRDEIARLRAELDALPRTNPAELEALRAAAQSERQAIEARAEATRAEAEATARTALIRGAVLRLQAALETGAPFDAALSDLSATGVALPQALSAHASGVPALAALQARFPEVARQALASSTRPDETAGIGSRVTAFLSAQTGLRSLTPQEGSDPDAVLSRAEAAVQAGDLARALTEMEALPPPGIEATAAWRQEAETRLAATAAAQGLIADFAKP